MTSIVSGLPVAHRTSCQRPTADDSLETTNMLLPGWCFSRNKHYHNYNCPLTLNNKNLSIDVRNTPMFALDAILSNAKLFQMENIQFIKNFVLK